MASPDVMNRPRPRLKLGVEGRQAVAPVGREVARITGIHGIDQRVEPVLPTRAVKEITVASLGDLTGRGIKTIGSVDSVDTDYCSEGGSCDGSCDCGTRIHSAVCCKA
ncbi:MAG TPA: hypothetical protein VLF93_05590 [Candidatus Saccharimonadales bacterium]|nr:hypothetical protein [Candidatus Saccharimonadales bacterium]